MFYTHYNKKSGNQPNSPHFTHPIEFAVTHNQGRSATTLLEKGNRFMISDKFIWMDHGREVGKQLPRNRVGLDLPMAPMAF